MAKTTRKGVDKLTREWIRNASDEKAARNGCRFDLERGMFTVNWIQDHCMLYEGEWAGQPMMLRDWALEAVMRLFSWVKWSDRWGREIRRFRSASIWAAKKNKKSPTVAALGLHLLCGDGEPGQKVYLAAKDGGQAAQIVGRHTFEMVMASEKLRRVCTLNRNLWQITHEPSRSVLRPISSGDDRSQKAQEGLNGSVIVDETHIVDRAFMDRISRAGISRSEPLHIEVSTAGDDPDGYGYERWEYGRDVANGVRENEALFFMTHEAPQDLTDEQLDKNPVKYGKMANPAWGHTIGEEEYLADYAESKRSPSALAKFKKYRLNIWQNAANPFIAQETWDKCGETYTVNDCIGMPCVAAIDLARVKDSTSMVLLFQDEAEELIRFFPYFWLPEAAAREVEDKVSYRRWADAGLVTLTEGDVCDYNIVYADIAEIHKKVNILKLGFDPKFAEELTQKLEAVDGIPRVQYTQTWNNLGPPTEEFERRAIAGELRHPKHSVFTWQMGNASVVTTRAGDLKRIVKRNKHAYQKVDGVQAAIMALGMTMQEPIKKKFSGDVLILV